LPARLFRFEHAPIKSALTPGTHSVAAASYASMHPTSAEPGQAIEHRKAPFLVLIEALYRGSVASANFFKAAPVSDRAVAR
jgi:hypothetical protein